MVNKIYNNTLLEKKIVLDYSSVNNNFLSNVLSKLKNDLEGLCIDQGYIKPNSIKIINYSTGELYENKIQFNIIYECLIANPVESQVLECKVKSVTKIGVRGELNNDDSNPLVIFIARDHHYNNELFSEIKEDDIINVRVIGKRYELNDKYISIIAEIVDYEKKTTIKKTKKK